MLWFEAISKLKINLEKSIILPIGNVEDIEDLAAKPGCGTRALPSTYLGLPLGMRCNSLQVWEGMEERFRKKLPLWKRQYISNEGRITLIKSTLTNMPIYIMSLFQIPNGVKSRLEKFSETFCGAGAI